MFFYVVYAGSFILTKWALFFLTLGTFNMFLNPGQGELQ